MRFPRLFVPLPTVMLQGHGDDTYRYGDVRVNFSSNIYGGADLSALKSYLSNRLEFIGQYPEPEAYSLEMLIAEREGIPNECVLVTNGATDAIYLIAQMLAGEGYRHYHIPQPTFSEYEDACRMFGMTEGDDGILWLCNPNNPTGQVINPSPNTAITVLDQSYELFTLQPLMSAREAVACEKIIQLHSMTKTYAVPGLRLGYVVAAAPVMECLRRYVRPWSVNTLAIEAGKWLTKHDVVAVPDIWGYLKETQRLRMRLNEIPGISVAPTDTCFMLAEIKGNTAADLKDYLIKEHRLLIRDASNFHGLTPRHFRISTQRPDENDLLVEAIREFISQADGEQTL